MTLIDTPTEAFAVLTEAQSDYLEAFWCAQARYLGARTHFRGLEVGDILGFCSLALTANIANKMARNPNPTTYAIQRLFSGTEDLRRRERAQAGAGAYGTRRAVTGHAADAALESYVAVGDADLADEACERALLEDALASIDEDLRDLLVRIDGEGYSVAEVAKQIGLARETVSRKHTRALKAVRLEFDRATGPAA